MEVVIVGGGPIGCWTALQVMRQRPSAKVTIYERHAEYQRDHVMTIDRRSFNCWAVRWQPGDAFLQDAFTARATCRAVPGKLRRGVPQNLDIRTLDMERILREHCLAKGVTFIIKQVASPAETMSLHPDCSWFVAADGAHSRMRTALWGRGHLKRRDIYPSLDFNYKSFGQPEYLRVNTFDSMGHVYAENVGLERDGVSDVNIRLVVSKEQYDAVPQATFKHPLVVEEDSAFWDSLDKEPHYGRTPKEDFYTLLALRAAHANDRPTDEQVTMTKIHLSQYRAKSFARTVEHDGCSRSWFLVGDAAMGMPFFRAVNSGMILGSQLAYLLTSRSVPGSLKVTAYNFVTRPSRVVRESARILAKEMLIKVVRDVARPMLLAILRSPFASLLQRPLDRLVGYAKYGKAHLVH